MYVCMYDLYSNTIKIKATSLWGRADQLFASAFGFGKYIDLLATDKSRYFAQPRPIIVKYQLKMAS